VFGAVAPEGILQRVELRKPILAQHYLAFARVPRWQSGWFDLRLPSLWASFAQSRYDPAPWSACFYALLLGYTRSVALLAEVHW